MFQGIAQNIQIYLSLSAIFFAFGVMAVLSRKNAVGIFMGVELMLNAAALNFVAFQAFRKPGADNWLHGHIFSLFIIILAAIEAAVALAIVLRIFNVKQSIDPDQATELKG
ncbi:MAG: NADH-quinone oxidoreductase subunit NuoK [Bdellovibrionales bacterium]|nr:NADH-quinone oxidoreductase subunit NuoK [Bdellovibrionales bacterium]